MPSTQPLLEEWLVETKIYGLLCMASLFQVVAIGDKFVDMSMSSKLNKYSELIKGAA